MFDPNDVFVSILGHERLTYLGVNLELYGNFSFRDKLHISVVYNGEKDLTKNNLSYDSLNHLSENRGYYVGALDGINASLKDFIESDRNIGVIHNFDYLFFYDNAFRVLIDDFIKTNKGVLMWRMKNAHPPERAVFQTDCFVITKEFAEKIYPINPKDDITIFYRKALAKDAEGDMDIMEEWFFQRLVNILMKKDLDKLNKPNLEAPSLEGIKAVGDHQYVQNYPYIKKTHDMVINKLCEYCFFITGESPDIMKTLEEQGSVSLMAPSEGPDTIISRVLGHTGVYDSKYHSLHTHHYEILRPLLIMFKYNLNNKKMETIDRVIKTKVSLKD